MVVVVVVERGGGEREGNAGQLAGKMKRVMEERNCLHLRDEELVSSVFSPEFSQGVVGGCVLGGVNNHIKA